MPRVNRSPRNSVNDRPSPWRLMLRRQRRLVKPALWLGGACVVAAVVATGIHSAGLMTPHGTLAGLPERLGHATAISGLTVTDVQIQGRANTPEPLLRSALGVNKGDPILGFSLERARADIEKLSWVEHATVERRLPGTVVVYLQERRPFAIWQNQGKFVLVDRVGQVVADQDVSQFKDLPMIVGAGAPAAAAELLDALTDRPALAEKVSAGVRVGERRWNLRMTSGTDVLLPEGHTAIALDRLMQLERDHAVLERPLAAIDLRLPDRLVLRPRADAKDGGASPPTATSVPPTPVIAKKPT